MEAHFVNKDGSGKIIEGWPVGSKWHIPQHETLDERINLAMKYISEFDFPIPVYVDNIENEFNTKYAAWPDRAYIIFENKIIYVSHVNEDGSRDMAWVEEIEKLVA